MAFILPPDLTDELSAVNTLLQAIGEAPVNSIEISESVDVAATRQTLQEVSNAVQTQGWWFNREYGMKLTPEATSNEIVLPRNTLKVSKAYDTEQQTGTLRVSRRAGKLYDPNNSTFVWDGPVWVDLVVKLDWDDLPESARSYITIRAAKLYQGRIQTNALVDRITDGEVLARLVTLNDEEDEAVRHNELRDNPDTYNRLHGRARRRT